MSYQVFIPEVNPLHIILSDVTPLPQYNSKHPTDYQHEDIIRRHEQYVEWIQPWQLSDALRLQIHSNLGPVQGEIYDVYGRNIFSPTLANVAQSFFDPNFRIYQLDQGLSIFPEGYYQLKIKIGSPVTINLETNWFEIRTKIDDTILCQYKHHKHYADAYFENGWSPMIRTYGALEFEKPASTGSVYENQRNNLTRLSWKPYDIWRWYTGGPEGIPTWAIMKYNVIAGCSTLNFDGRLYTIASEGATFDKNEIKDYPMRGWSIELRDKLARTSKIITTDGIGVEQNNLGLTVVANVESKGFVNDDVGGSYHEVLDVG